MSWTDAVIEDQAQRERDDALLFAEWQYGRLYPDEAPALDFGSDFDPSDLEDGAGFDLEPTAPFF